jgi:hypothetical protein
MAEQTPVVYMDGGGAYPAQMFRLFAMDFLRDSDGTSLVSGGTGGVLRADVATTGDMAVVQNGTPNMSVNVLNGVAYIKGTSVTNQGVYRCYNDGSINLAIGAAHATLPRRDLVIAEVQDNTHDASGQNRWRARVVAGTAAASPADPSLPNSSIPLARVRVAANDTAINTADIDDLRKTVGPLPVGGIRRNDTLNAGQIVRLNNDTNFGNHMQLGTANLATTGSTAAVTEAVTFGQAFASAPRVWVQADTSNLSGQGTACRVRSLTATGFTVTFFTTTGTDFAGPFNIPIFWLATGQ